MDPKNRNDWTRWKTAEYERVAYVRAVGIIKKIKEGRYPMGVVNLLSNLPISVWYPYREQAERIANRIWGQLQQLIADPEFPNLERYNFEITVRDAGYDLEGKSLATIVFRYNPDDVRDLSKDSRE